MAEMYTLSELLVLGNGIGMHYDFVDLYLVQRPIISIDWLSFHQIQGLKPINDLSNI